MAGDTQLTDVMYARGEGRDSRPKEHTCVLEPPLQVPFTPVHLKKTKTKTKTKALSKILHKAPYIWLSHFCLGPIRTQGHIGGWGGENNSTIPRTLFLSASCSGTNLPFSHSFLIVLEPSPLVSKWILSQT